MYALQYSVPKNHFEPTIYRDKWSTYHGGNVNLKLYLISNQSQNESTAFFRFKMDSKKKIKQILTSLFKK